MYKVKIFSIGKTKEPWLNEAISEYSKRLGPILSIEWVIAKDNLALFHLLQKEVSYIALDPQGKILTSEAFSDWIQKQLEQEGSRLNFVIGGADGLSKEVVAKARSLLSLSPLTFTHQLTRLILLEQLYRGFEIQKNSPYHK